MVLLLSGGQWWGGGGMCLFPIRNVFLRFINPPPLPQLTEGNLSEFATVMREGESDSLRVPGPGRERHFS